MFLNARGLALAAAGLALVAACTRSPAPTPAPPSPPPEATPTPTPVTARPAPAEATPVPEGVPRRGGVFRRLWQDPPTLDPHLTTDVISAGVVLEVFSGLVTISTDLTLEPDLAERWEIGGDGRTYTFYLRPNARFQDGRPVTAEDVRASLERATDPELGSPVADVYLGDIVGVREKLDGKADRIAGLEVVDDHVLRITIDRPRAYFLAKLTYPTSFVVDVEQARQGPRWTERPNATGPFILREYRIGERIVLERNPYYYREPAYLDRVEFILTGGNALAMYENDEIDITGVPLPDLDRVRDPNDPLSRDLRIAPPEFALSYIGLNVNEPPFDDPKVRQALAHAIDKEVIAEEVLAGLLVPAYGILPPGFPGFNPDLEGLRYDPERARRLLQESRYAGNLPRIVLTVPGTGGSIGLDLEVILDMWKRTLGVEVEVQQVEWATFLQDLNERRLQAFGGLGWQADYPDPQNFLEVLFHSASSQNHTGYSNPEVDRLLEEAGLEMDFERRVALYRQAEEIIVRDAPIIPLWYPGERYVLIKPWVKGYKLTPLLVPRLREVWIER